MPNLGLSTRLCPKCQLREAHRTLYVKTESHDRSRWHRIFWACMKCGSLNHVTLPVYKLEYVPFEPPSPLVACAVEALKQGPKNLDELVQTMKGNGPGIRHVFTTDVRIALEYLKRRGIVSELPNDLTERVLTELRTRQATSNHLRLCPAEAEKGVEAKGLVSVYAQHRLKVKDREVPARTGQLKLTPVGFVCISCGYHRIDQVQMTRL
jgi:hypothetical protein